jgi:hypothetical protein
MKRLGAVFAVALCAAAVAQAAPAGAPLGKYTCYRFGTGTTLYQGWVTLTSGSAYAAYTGAKGTYSSAGATLTFKTGPYHGWVGTYKYDQTRKAHIIEMRQGGSYRATCSKKA